MVFCRTSLIMREDTLPRLKSPTGLIPGMLKRTKYSRLQNEPLTSLEDRSERVLPLKRTLCLNSDQGLSTLRDFIPRMANIRIQSPISITGWTRHTDSTSVLGQVEQTEWTTLDAGQDNFALRRTKRPITLHRITSLPWTPGCVLSEHHRHREGCWDSDCSEKGGVKTAIHHNIKYIGSVEVTQSMRTLDFNTRMQVTREAISRLCEKTSTKTLNRSKRLLHKNLGTVLGQIDRSFSGSRVIVSVSTESLTLIAVSSLQKIAHHSMQSISFASGSDPNMADYIAYVAKDLANHRACHILECPLGGAAEVINSIGKAFETRFHQMLSQSSPLLSPNHRSSVSSGSHSQTEQRVKLGPTYYNMVPGKSHPCVGTEDLLASEEDPQKDVIVQRVSPSAPESLYGNCSTTEAPSALPTERSDVSAEPWSVCQTHIKDLIQRENWFHGRLDRHQAEALLSCSGDFLVRESSSASSQYVLSGMEGTTVRHLLLVDPNGQVRTQDKVFHSIAHLIRFHMESQTPILSGTGELCLKHPIIQRH